MIESKSADSLGAGGIRRQYMHEDATRRQSTDLPMPSL